MVPQVTKFVKLVVEDHQTEKMAIIKNIKMFVNEVVADIRNVVVVSLNLTTTHPFVVRKITTDRSIWSLLLLTTEPITTTNDHRFLVVIDL
jgi:hypothetical protein